MFWLEGALESGKCYRTCRLGISVLEHTHCAFRAHQQGLRGYEQTKYWWAIASAEEKEIINQEEPIKYHKSVRSQTLDDAAPIISKIQGIKGKENFMKQEELFRYHEFEQSETLDEDAPVIPKRQNVRRVKDESYEKYFFF